MARLGDDEPAMGVDGVAEEMLAAAGVVQTHDGRAGERRPAEGEEVVGGVVQKDSDVGRGRRVDSGAEQPGEAAGLGEELPMGPGAVTELERRPVGAGRVVAVGAKQRRGVRGRHRGLTGGGHVPAAQRSPGP